MQLNILYVKKSIKPFGKIVNLGDILILNIEKKKKYSVKMRCYMQRE